MVIPRGRGGGRKILDVVRTKKNTAPGSPPRKAKRNCEKCISRLQWMGLALGLAFGFGRENLCHINEKHRLKRNDFKAARGRRRSLFKKKNVTKRKKSAKAADEMKSVVCVCVRREPFLVENVFPTTPHREHQHTIASMCAVCISSGGHVSFLPSCPW